MHRKTLREERKEENDLDDQVNIRVNEERQSSLYSIDTQRGILFDRLQY